MTRVQRSTVWMAAIVSGAIAASGLLTAADARRMPTADTPVRRAVSIAGHEIAQVSEQWAKHWSTKHLEAVIALYADDAVFLPATGTRVTGRAAIRDLFAKALENSSSEVRVTSKVTEPSGDLAYDGGEYEETSTSGGVTRTGRGNYLVVLRRDGKGEWRILEHMWSDVPATGH